MSTGILAAVLLSALLHASWNAIVRVGSDRALSTAVVMLGAAVLSALALPFCTAPAPASWPFIAASPLVLACYYVLLAATYRSGDMSYSYPIIRGTSPLLVALAAPSVLHQSLTAGQWAAVALISAGILALGFGAARGADVRRTTIYALATACMVAATTLVDGAGVRHSGSAAGYTLWIFMLSGAWLAAWTLATRGRALLAYGRGHLHFAIIGGTGSVASYGIALWAMTQASIASVAALRETSILFGTAIAALFLRENVRPARLAAVLVIAAGAVSMRLA